MNNLPRIQRSMHIPGQGNSGTLVAKEMDETNKNVTINSMSSIAPRVESTTSSRKDSEHSPKSVQRVGSGDYTEEEDNVSLIHADKNVQRNPATGLQEVSRGKNSTKQVTQHVDINLLQRSPIDVTKVSIQNVTEGGSTSGTMSHKADTQVQNTSSDTHSNSIKQSVNKENHYGNVNNSLSPKNVAQEKVVISLQTNETNITAEKSRALEKLKRNFLEKNNRSHVEPNNSHVSRVHTLKSQRKSELPRQNKSNSAEKAVLPKSTQSSEDGKNGTSLLDKVVLRHEKTDSIKNATADEKRTEGNKEHLSNKAFVNKSRTLSTTSAKSEKIVVHLDGKLEKSKDNKGNAFVNVASGTGDSQINVIKDFGENEKIQKEKSSITKSDAEVPRRDIQEKQKHDSAHFGSHQTQNNVVSETENSHGNVIKDAGEDDKNTKENSSIAKSDAKVPRRDIQEKQKGGSGNTKIAHVSDQTHNNPVTNSTQSLDKDKVQDKVQVKQIDRFLDNSKDSGNNSVHLSKTKAPNDKDPLTEKTPRETIQDNTQKLERSDHSRTTSDGNAGDEKVKHTQKDMESQTLQKGAGGSHEELKKSIYFFRFL